MNSTPGYSGRPLHAKLGMAAGMRVAVIHEPGEYREWLGDGVDGVVFSKSLRGHLDLVHFFVTRRTELARRLPSLREAVRPDGVIWVSWPKRAAKVATDVSEDIIREAALPLGLVDVKVCAVSPVWSGLKLTIRRELR